MSVATTDGRASILEQFKWEPQPEAERLVCELVAEFLSTEEWAAGFARRMRDEAGVRFHDCVDWIDVGSARVNEVKLKAAGFTRVDEDEGKAGYDVYRQPFGIFPVIALSGTDRIGVDLRVESVADFALAHRLELLISEPPLSAVRRARIEKNSACFVVERHGCRTGRGSRLLAEQVLRNLENLRIRNRGTVEDEQRCWQAAESSIDAAIADLGVDYACDLFFSAEREYWQRRNRAAQVQKARQDRLGIGWANHDHHTYRSSRRHFTRLIAIWEKLGFVCRERFYAGKDAGWGAQVMEQPNAGIVTFNDVDLAPDELFIDFAHEPLPERKELGTVGLWCALHGESFLEAGMHHLECMFDFAALKEQLERDHGIGVMKPFTDFPHLRQAFTQGERWPVRPERIDRLLSAGQITAEQAEKFRTEGAIGSHLENLERNQGFKGFNQTGVSEIIAATDPRRVNAEV